MSEVLELQELEEETPSVWPCANSYESARGVA